MAKHEKREKKEIRMYGPIKMEEPINAQVAYY